MEYNTEVYNMAGEALQEFQRRNEKKTEGSIATAVTGPGVGCLRIFRSNFPRERDACINKGVFGRVLSQYQSIRGGYFLGKHPTEVFGKVRYGLSILPNSPVGFGTNPIPVPETSVTSVLPRKIPRVPPVYPTEHALRGYLFCMSG